LPVLSNVARFPAAAGTFLSAFADISGAGIAAILLSVYVCAAACAALAFAAASDAAAVTASLFAVVA
jgi:hypothetical protein